MEPHLLSPLTLRLPHDVAREASMAPAQIFVSEAHPWKLTVYVTHDS